MQGKYNRATKNNYEQHLVVGYLIQSQKMHSLLSRILSKYIKHHKNSIKHHKKLFL